MKKFFSLFAAILFAGSMMADEFHLEKVTSVVAGKTYAFVRNDKALIAPSSNALQTGEVNWGTIDGTQEFLWKLVAEADSFKLSNVSKGDEKFLRNSSSTNLSLSNNEGSNHWVISFEGEVALIANSTRFVGETAEGSNQYKAYAMKDLESKGHDFMVYELKEGPSANASLLADNLNIKSVMVKDLPFVADTNIIVTASNLTADITTSVKGSNITVPATLAKEGGKLDIHISAAAEGEFSDTIVLTSGSLKKEVAIEGNVVKPVGEGTEENPFTLADVAKFKNGLADKHWVKGFIVGCAKSGGLIEDDPEKIDSASIVLGTTADQTENLVPVQLAKTSNAEKAVREALNVKAHPENIGHEVLVFGKLEEYQKTTGIKSTSDFRWVGGEPKSNDASFKWLKIQDEEVTAVADTFRYEVAPDVDLAAVTVTFELNHAAAKANRESGFLVKVPASAEEKPVDSTLVVTAEDESKVTYVIRVSRQPKSKDASFKWLKIEDHVVTAVADTFRYEVPAEEDLAAAQVTFELNDPKAKANRASGFLVKVPNSSEEKPVDSTLVVTAEDENVKVTYVIRVTRKAADAPKSNDATIKELKINGSVIEEQDGVFAYEVDAKENLAEVEVLFVLNDAHATADKENPFKIKVPASSEEGPVKATINVTAEDGTTKKAYMVAVTRKAAEEAIDNIQAEGQAIKRLINGCIVIMKNGRTYDALGAEIQ